MKFYLGTDRGNWLWHEQFTTVPLFVSHRTLRRRKTVFPRATTDWALDSGGFTELDRNNGWVTTPQEYVEAVERYSAELGRLDWASPQDWMCEPWMVEKTGKSVHEHQRLTVENFLVLRDLAPHLPFIPVLQGWELDDYLRCVDMYREAGVNLADYSTVGIGSVCRRESTDDIGLITSTLSDLGLHLHGFGVKSQGVRLYGTNLTSSDSMAWSFGGRRLKKKPANCPSSASSCAHCPHFALEWRARVLAAL